MRPNKPPSDYDSAPDPLEPSWPETRKIDDTWGFEEDSRAGAEADSAVSGPLPPPRGDSNPSPREPSDAANLPGGLRERYRLIHVLGKGGFATVYLAYDSVLDQEVAIKVLRLDSGSGTASDRFLREARIGVKLRHPHIVTIYDIIQTEDGLQLLMEYLPGGSLTQRIRAYGPLEPRAAIHVTRQVAQALAYAHHHGVVHRDVKPSNILLARGGVVKLGDFGTAAHVDQHDFTQTGMVVGTPLYMAPEQGSDSREADNRADLYSLALTLYHILTGKAPRILDLEEVPDAFRGLLRRAAALERDERPDSAEEFIALLDEIDEEYARADYPVNEDSVEMPAPPPRPAPVTPPSRPAAWKGNRPQPRRRGWIPSGGLLALLVLVAAALAAANHYKAELYSYLHPRPAARDAAIEGSALPAVPVNGRAPATNGGPAVPFESPAPIPSPVGQPTPPAATPAVATPVATLAATPAATPIPAVTPTPAGTLVIEAANNSQGPAVPLPPVGAATPQPTPVATAQATPAADGLLALEKGLNEVFKSEATLKTTIKTLRDPEHPGMTDQDFRSLIDDANSMLRIKMANSARDPLPALALYVVLTRAGSKGEAELYATKALESDEAAGRPYGLTLEKIQQIAQSPNLGVFEPPAQ